MGKIVETRGFQFTAEVWQLYEGAEVMSPGRLFWEGNVIID